MHLPNARLGVILRRSSLVIQTIVFNNAVTNVSNSLPNIVRGIFCLAMCSLVVVVGSAHADSGFPNEAFRHGSHYDYPIDFTLTLSNSNIALRAGNIDYQVALERISISVFSLQDKHLQWGFNSGASYLSPDNDPAVAGLRLNGYHAGFALRANLGSNPQLGLHADYRYQETRNETTNQTTSLSWHEWTLAATGKIILGQRLGFTLGWAYRDINAQRRTRGDINDTLSLQLNSPLQSQFELQWFTDASGRISIAWQRGSYENIAFNFSRAFK